MPTVLGIPYDASSSFLRGAALAPPLIREALRSPAANHWTERGTDLGAPGALHDAGDLALDGGGDVRTAIEAGVRKLLEQGQRPIVLGGDHSITYPIVRAVRRFQKPLSILHLDAHPDLYPEFEGDPYSHACPFARILEEGLADQLVQVGIRTMNGVQRAQAERYGVEAGPPVVLRHPAYVSIDLDVLDPAFAPGVSHREPGGLSVREVLAIIQGLDAPVVGADVVELNPTRDPAGITAPVAAKLVKEIAAKMLA